MGVALRGIGTEGAMKPEIRSIGNGLPSTSFRSTSKASSKKFDKRKKRKAGTSSRDDAAPGLG
jgi:hypothetical protein